LSMAKYTWPINELRQFRAKEFSPCLRLYATCSTDGSEFGMTANTI
jgi:hypothetical protein